MNALPEKQFLKRGEVMRGTGWSKVLLKKFEDTKKLVPYRPTSSSRKLYYRCQVVKLQEQAGKGEMT